MNLLPTDPRAATFSLVAALLFCTTASIAADPLPSSRRVRGIELHGHWTKEDLVYLERTLANLPASVVESIPSITLTPNVIGHERDLSIAGTVDDTSAITLSEDHLEEGLIHEIAHAYAILLQNRGEPLALLWIATAGNAYDETRFVYPASGVLTPYGATNYAEDIAEWVRVLYTNDPDVIKPLQKKRVKADARYAAKLDLLQRYGFLTDSQYQQWKIRLESTRPTPPSATVRR